MILVEIRVFEGIRKEVNIYVMHTVRVLLDIKVKTGLGHYTSVYLCAPYHKKKVALGLPMVTSALF